MEVARAIRERRSAGTFASQPVPRGVIEMLITGAVWAPNHRLTEPWRFSVVAGAARNEMAGAIEAADVGGLAKTARKKLLRAPAFVVVSQVVAEGADKFVEQEDYAACCCATQNLLLAAHAAGLASKWSTGALATSVAAKTYLGLQLVDRIVGYVYLGYAAGEGSEKGARAAPSIDWRGL